MGGFGVYGVDDDSGLCLGMEFGPLIRLRIMGHPRSSLGVPLKLSE